MDKEKLFEDLKVLQAEFMKTHFKHASDLDNMIIELAMKQAANFAMNAVLNETRMFGRAN